MPNHRGTIKSGNMATPITVPRHVHTYIKVHVCDHYQSSVHGPPRRLDLPCTTQGVRFVVRFPIIVRKWLLACKLYCVSSSLWESSDAHARKVRHDHYLLRNMLIEMTVLIPLIATFQWLICSAPVLKHTACLPNWIYWTMLAAWPSLAKRHGLQNPGGGTRFGIR